MSVLENHRSAGPENWNKDNIKSETKPLLDDIYEYSKRLYAERERSVLIILQGLDASGKDGLTRTLFRKVSPAWVNVHSFKKPSEKELAHDYLWRVHQCTPEKGMITVFNRSHYEDILVPSVYGYVEPEEIEKRYTHINQFEQYLEDNGVKVLKFFLNVGYEKQEVKLRERINTHEKHWKHSDSDWETRERWDDFIKVYETLFERCNAIPWHIIPADHNWGKLYAAAGILVKTLKEMDPKFPELKTERFKPDYSKSKYRY